MFQFTSYAWYAGLLCSSCNLGGTESCDIMHIANDHTIISVLYHYGIYAEHVSWEGTELFCYGDKSLHCCLGAGLQKKVSM